MAKGNYSIYKTEDKGKSTKMRGNLSVKEMREHLKNNPEYKGGEGYGFGGRRTYPAKKVLDKFK